MPRPHSTTPFIGTVVIALAFLALRAGRASADVLELKDGTRLDVKVLKEEGGWLTVKTVADVRRVHSAQVVSRTPGEPACEIYEKMKSKLESNPKDVDALWKLYAVSRDNAALLPKGEPSRVLARLLKASPDHELARDANGEVRWDGKWVLKTDLPRLEAEKEREKKRVEWEAKLGVPVTLAEGEHWIVVDNSEAKDPAKRAQQLDDAYAKMCEILGTDRLWDGHGSAIAFRTQPAYLAYLEQYQASAKMGAAKYEAAKSPQIGGFWNHRPYAFVMRFVTQHGDEGMWHAFVNQGARVCLWSRFSFPPTWLEEGLAGTVEADVMGVQKVFSVGPGKKQDDKGTREGGKDKERKGSDLAEGVNEYKDRCIDAVKEGEFPAMRKFLRMGVGDYTPAEAGGALGLTTWLMQRDAGKFRELIDALRKKPAVDDAPWKQVYDYALIEDMETEWREWVTGQW